MDDWGGILSKGGHCKTIAPGHVDDHPSSIFNDKIEELFIAKAGVTYPSMDYYYRPSTLYDSCPVLEYFARVKRVKMIDGVDKTTRLLMDAGSQAHEYFQNSVFGPAEILSGNWHCNKCNHIVHNQSIPKVCINCKMERDPFNNGDNSFNFRENILIAPLGIPLVGHNDGIIVLDGHRFLLEMKSKSADTFDKISKPSRKDLFQMSLYMWMYTGEKLDDGIYVLINRNNYQFKIAFCKKSEELVEEALHKIDFIEKAVDGGYPPLSGRKCKSKACYMANNCVFKKECWDV